MMTPIIDTSPTSEEIYTPVARTEAEWLELHRPQMQKVFDMWLAGNYEKARHWHTMFVRPLRRNAKRARLSDTGSYGCREYDMRRATTAAMLKQGNRRIIVSEVSLPASQFGDTAGPEKSLQANSPNPAADNNPPETETVANLHDTASTLKTELISAAPAAKFTKFSVGDSLRIPVHFGLHPVFEVVNDPRYSRVYYGFMFEVGGVAGLKYYSEQELSELNPRAGRSREVLDIMNAVSEPGLYQLPDGKVVDHEGLEWEPEFGIDATPVSHQPRPRIRLNDDETEASVSEPQPEPEPEDTEDEYSKPTAKRARLSPETRKAWLGMIVAGMDAIRDGDIEHGKTQVNEYTRKLMCCYAVGDIVFMAVEEQRKADAISVAADEIPNPNGIVQLPLLDDSGEAA